MKRSNNMTLKSFLLPGVVIASVCSILAACANGPQYDYAPVNTAIISKGLTIKLQAKAENRFKTLPVVVNSPNVQFNLVTVDPNFAAEFNFQEARTGYMFNQYFTQKKLVNQFIENTLMALDNMRIKTTKAPQVYQLDAKILKLSFTTKTLKNFEDLKKGYKDYILGHMRTAYRIEDTDTHTTVWTRTYDTSATVVMPQPGQTAKASAGLLYRMMTDSSLKFGHDIARECSFYQLPNISCSK